jgi:OOP family OmpA-OmpF porin
MAANTVGLLPSAGSLKIKGAQIIFRIPHYNPNSLLPRGRRSRVVIPIVRDNVGLFNSHAHHWRMSMQHASCRFIVVLLLLLAGLPVAASDDAEGCRDNPLFTRMPGYYIYNCEAREFDAVEMPVGRDADEGAIFEPVEGAVSYVVYWVREGAKVASPLQILRNHLNAAKAAGGTVVKEFGEHGAWIETFNDAQQRTATLKFVKGGREIWVYVGSANDGEIYAIGMVERQAMKQDVAVNELLDQLNKDGFLALQVNFDTNKATIKPDSNPTLDQAAEMLKLAPEIKIEVAGHTDNVGTPESNQKLSQGRAESVVKALVARGIAGARLSAKGYGQSAPVADNRSEDGRARNRRVELVKR